jgi:hypothetical protein
MATVRDNQQLYDRVAVLREELTRILGSRLGADPRLAEDVVRRVNDLLAQIEAINAAQAPPGDNGLAALIGIGTEAVPNLSATHLPLSVAPYDETVASERILAIADLYYIYQHERIGVFRVVRKLEELFRAGTLALSAGDGAYGLYRFDRREVLRYTERDRAAAYRRAFGYGSWPPPPGGRPNREFHPMFANFNDQIAQFWRDKRISDVIRDRANDPSYGSIAIVRRSGLDLRNNLKFASYGHLNVLRVETMALLEESMRLLNGDDVKKQFGADNAWDVIEEVLTRYFNEPLTTSQRQRMAVAGREVLRWLAQPHILQSGRTRFEALLLEVAEYAEEWITSAESLGLTRRGPVRRPSLPWDPRPVRAGRGAPVSLN